MRHRRRTNRLGCKTAHRKAMIGNMVISLLKHGRIVTTVPRAKEVRRMADKMVSLAKRSRIGAEICRSKRWLYQDSEDGPTKGRCCHDVYSGTGHRLTGEAKAST